jgi:NTP pyrophosphatase (non-canonical NTP hydrolase)
MNFNEYQKAILKFNICPEATSLPHALTGLVAEVGELQGLFQKHYRNDGPLKTADVIKEIGDVTYYLANLCTVLGLDFQAIAAGNIQKLEDRKARNVIKGSGDER